MNQLYIHWHPSPEIFSIGAFGPRWYGVLFAIAFVVGYYLMKHIFKREGVKLDYIDNLLLYFFIGTIVGARLGHCLFYEPQFYLSHPLQILKIWEGGLASHGAGIG
ncbi:MAG: prolipoprotein diacylglyceryl transferase, partial [Salinivirgaceae bacterium]|nr:prolipoprotein diacylglyceryl transferase [Salinivirgaceae bacterium]